VTAEESRLLEKVDLARLPKHVAVIIGRNGRWAQKRPPAADCRASRRNEIGSHDIETLRA